VLRMIQRSTPGVGEHRDVHLDKSSNQFETATVFVTLVVLVAANTAVIFAGAKAGSGVGLAAGIAVAVVTVGAWLLALNDFSASLRDTVSAVGLLLRGYNGRAPAAVVARAKALRAQASEQKTR